MNEINGFTFYRNYFELIRYLPNEERLRMYDAIFGYIFEEIEPELDGLNKGIWINLKMPLNTSKTNIENGKKGGRPKKQNNNRNKNRKKTDEKPKAKANNISNFLFLISNFKFNNNINNLLKEYLEVRIKNKYTITESVVNRLCNKLIQHSTNDEEKEEIILNAINGAWKDFYPLKKESNNNYKKTESQIDKLEREIQELDELERKENEKTRST